ncbi:MAG TPA: aldolase/citrate lyase family protein [Terriglobia bacterium]|nr:aldolase/citrate lyase family protein [Terriglobia bacterium]
MPVENAGTSGVLENPLKIMLREGKAVIGSTITVASAETAAQVAALGFDFLWIEMEHSPITLETLRNIILATRGLKAVPITRVPVNELWTAKRVLDAGSLGVIFPFCSTPELARQAVAACKYPPHGRRGSGPGLAAFRWPAVEGYHTFADNNVLVVIIVEEERAVEQIDAIAATPGVDVIFVGTSDLSFSMGYRGQSDHPRVQEALKKVVAAGKANGKFLGLPVKDSDQIKKYIDQGFQWFQTATELGLMAKGARQLLEPLGRAADPLQKGLLY